MHFHSVFIADNVHAAALLRVPYIVTPHGGYAERVLGGSNRRIKRLWLAARERAYLRSAYAVQAVSEAERAELARRWPDLPIRLVPNAVELPDLPESQAGLRRDFVFIGRLATYQKGLDLMLRGFARFARAPEAAGFRLIVAGPDWRGDEAALRELAGTAGVADRVVFAGPVFDDAKVRLLAGARAFVHTSRWEGLPLAPLEALARATPVLVTPETNLAELVARLGAGIACHGDEAAIAEGFLRLAKADETEHRQMAGAARRLVEDNFTWPRIRQQFRQMYEDALTCTARPAVSVD